MIKTSKLTQSELQEILDYDPDAGIFKWKQQLSYRGKIGAVAGNIKTYAIGKGPYVEIGIHNIKYLAHRLVWLYMTGGWPVAQIDHIDGNGLNNKWSNLRAANNGQNGYNARLRKNNKSGFRGVTYLAKSQKWHARIMIDRALIILGNFTTKEEAVAAYQEIAKQKHKEFYREQ